MIRRRHCFIANIEKKTTWPSKQDSKGELEKVLSIDFTKSKYHF